MIPAVVVIRNIVQNYYIMNEKQGRCMVAALFFDVFDLVFYANFVPRTEYKHCMHSTYCID